PIGEYQAALPPGQSLAEMTEPEQDRALKTLSQCILEALQAPALESEQEPADSDLSTRPFVDYNETTSPEQIIRWRTRCRIWKEPLAEDCDVPMAWIPSDTAQKVGEFLLGVEPVTLRQWQVVAGWPQQEGALNPDPTEHGAPDQPVTGINQEQALEFCRRLAVRSGRYYELSSEEQWEHACRAGCTSSYSWGDTWSGMATAFANPWGLQKMHGSVWQWCRGEALRGGSWNDPFERRQASSRATAKDPLHPSSVGLRVCCLPFGTPYFQLEASKSQWRPLITRAACAQVLARPLNESEFSHLVQALQRFRILGILQLRLFLSLLADRLGDGADDPEHPLALVSDQDRLSSKPPAISNEVFTSSASVWRERGWHRLADHVKAPQQVLAELGLSGGKRQEALRRALVRSVAAFPEPL
ncbi:MAG: formylglycine-generating enzyme family protein, partial [Cyanobium sp.]